MNTFNALLFAAHGPPSGSTVRAHFFGNRLVIDPAGPTLEAAALIVSVGGIEQPQLFLNWLDEHGVQGALQPLTAQDIAILMSSAPPQLQPQLMKWRQRSRNQRQVWAWLASMSVAAALLGALLWWQAPRVAGALAAHIPVAAEVQLGQAALAQLRKQGGLIESGAMQQTVQEIGNRLTRGSRYHYRWIIKKDASVNAYAMPGGIVVVHSALLKKTASPTELAAVLAHEVQHIEQRHSLRQMIASLGWGALLTLTVGDVSAVTALLVHQAGALYFSRGMEDEADRLGFQALLRAGIAPDGMLTFFQKLEREDKAGKASPAPAWISSHPQTSERIAGIRALIASQPCPSCRPLAGDWKQLSATLAAAEK